MKRVLAIVVVMTILFSKFTSMVNVSAEIGSRSAFSQIEAESYNSVSSSNIQSFGITGGGIAIGYIQNGYYAVYNNINFGTGACTFKAKVATSSATTIQIRAGSSTGTLLGLLAVPSTGSYDTYQEMGCSISNITGVNNLYLVFDGPVNFDWCTFNRSAFLQIEAESYNNGSSSNIQSFDITEGGTVLGYIQSGYYTAYNNINFDTGVSTFTAKVATSSATTIQIRAGSSTGTLLGTLIGLQIHRGFS